jgi:hypothetical protein
MLSIAEYLAYLQKVKPVAAKTYGSILSSYARWIGKPLDELLPDDFLKARIEEFMAVHANPYTANTIVKACRGYARFIKHNYRPKTIEERLLRDDFYDDMYSIAYREVPESFGAEAISKEQLEELLLTINNKLLYAACIVHFYFAARPIELCQPYAAHCLELDKIARAIAKLGRRIVDFDANLICIPTAKSKERFRILPFDEKVTPYLKLWIKNLDRISRHSKNGVEWFTKRIKPRARRVGIAVTARTARKTFETLMSREKLEQWVINYWLGHKGGIPEKYRDMAMLIPFVREEVNSRHYILALL